ncbi:MAG: RtcB family protein [Candidatus Heimdallarchaeota archaeon]|nr:RtcB family protein [Candidatus Heimdallarchaeota archaeon]
MSNDNIPMKQIDQTTWEIPVTYKKGMRVPARLIVTPALKKGIEHRVIDQITNVATLPGIQKYAIALPDAHAGYGFPIGGVAAMDMEEGVISPGGVGFDINCGVRMLTTTLEERDVRPKIKELIEKLFRKVPAGVGVQLKHDPKLANLSRSEFDSVLENGAQWCQENGYAREADVRRIESQGKMPKANAAKVSDKAKSRGLRQLGTLGSGNHYLEIQVIKPGDIFDPEKGAKFGLTKPYQVTAMIHCGSRGFGHQVATDYLRTCLTAMNKYNIPIQDQELASVPINSQEGEDYFAAMSCASNMAYANRQVITYNVRQVFTEVFQQDEDDLGLDLIYDVAHNIAKIEDHVVDGKKKKLMVHRKGATRGFPPNHPEIPEEYKALGQPVLLGGSMETGSYLLTGTQRAMEVSFGSTAHGAGRTMSRSKAKRQIRGDFLQQKMREKGIYVKGASMPGLAEEAGFAYKDIDEVVNALKISGISHPIARVKPLGNVKG